MLGKVHVPSGRAEVEGLSYEARRESRFSYADLWPKVAELNSRGAAEALECYRHVLEAFQLRTEPALAAVSD